MYCLYTGKCKKFSGKYNILLFEECAEHLQKFIKLDYFVPFDRPQSGAVIKQLMTECDISRTAIPKPSKKQSNALIISTKTRMSQCKYF